MGNRECKVKGVSGQVLIDEVEVRRRWAEYFEDLLNVEDEREAVVDEGVYDLGMPVLDEVNGGEITSEEVIEAVGRMKSGKAPGMDGCAIECVKRGGAVLITG